MQYVRSWCAFLFFSHEMTSSEQYDETLTLYTGILHGFFVAPFLPEEVNFKVFFLTTKNANAFAY